MTVEEVKKQMVDYNGTLVMSTKTLCDMLGITRASMYNRGARIRKYTEGVHYILLDGSDIGKLTKKQKLDFDFTAGSQLTLWTLPGIAMKLKSMETDDSYEFIDSMAGELSKAVGWKVKLMRWINRWR